VLHADRAGLRLGVSTDGSAGGVRALLDEVDPHCALIREFSVRGASLDDVFLALTTKETADV
jgi:ABC-2 type transport system ATP-binding protein